MNIENLTSATNEEEQCTILANILNGLFAGLIPPEKLFSPDYIQCSDGNILDFAAFTAHLSHVREHTRKVDFEVIDVCICADRLAERHIATVSHLDGKVSKLEVYVFMRIRGNKIVALDEVSRVIEGNEGDRKLASATN
ncbi:nuclear transport factor 2 family protein [Oceanobacter mangrovi]|uniref:nuclear transport factor 2 family protein n=1 Tax=Oceanobacter mangrovi TaxID=2862510 RepID=UPI001C8EB8E9|nr:nuclear transport factor 2 family protein [Oceanobacter mangrovi]